MITNGSESVAAPALRLYDKAFREESRSVYPLVDALEREMGYALERERLENAARVLACPVKRNPPNWQHGRVLYAIARAYLAGFGAARDPVNFLDIGTAKGFSALCLRWAQLDDRAVPLLERLEGDRLTEYVRPGERLYSAAALLDRVISIDVTSPYDRIARNTIADPAGALTLFEILQPWPESQAIQFLGGGSLRYFSHVCDLARIHLAFVDGKHEGSIVYREGREIAKRQAPGDLVVFDDLQHGAINQAVLGLADVYALEILTVLPWRQYAIGRRK